MTHTLTRGRLIVLIPPIRPTSFTRQFTATYHHTFIPRSHSCFDPQKVHNSIQLSLSFPQLPSEACQEVSGSRRMSRVQCAGVCGVTAGCQGFSLTCADLYLGSSCRCFVCSAADLGAASTSLEATSGVLTSQVRSSFSLTVRSIPCGKFNGLILRVRPSAR